MVWRFVCHYVQSMDFTRRNLLYCILIRDFNPPFHIAPFLTLLTLSIVLYNVNGGIFVIRLGLFLFLLEAK